MLKLHFVTDSLLDVARKLQKLENWKNLSIEELLGQAQKVYVGRDEERQRQKVKSFGKVHQGKWCQGIIFRPVPAQFSKGNGRGRPWNSGMQKERRQGQYFKGESQSKCKSCGCKRKEERQRQRGPGLGKEGEQERCYKCGKAGHFKRECTELRTAGEAFLLMPTFEEE